MEIRICKFCGKGYEPMSHNQKFCTETCAHHYAGSITKSVGYHGTIKTKHTDLKERMI